MTRILLIEGHPDPSGERFCHALADAYAAGAEAHELRRIDIAAQPVAFIRTQDEWTHGEPLPFAAEAEEALLWAEHVVMVFPLWMGKPPAMMEAWLEQVIRPALTGVTPEGERQRPLAGRTARLIVTMGMPAPVYRWYYRAHGLRNLSRNVLRHSGFRSVSWSLIGAVEAAPPRHHQRWLARVGLLGRQAR